MRGRTRLTTPPGQEPRPADHREQADEVYSPAFALPREPRVPSRWRRPVLVVVALAVLAASSYGIYATVTSQQAEDPALTGGPDPTPVASP